MANFWLLYSTNRYLPEIRHVLDTGRSHPERLFASMLGLAGALTTFSSSVHAISLPSYDHEDLSGCFGALDRVLRQLLETVVPERFVSIPLELTRTSIHAAAIDQDRYLTSNAVYLAVNAEGVDADRIARLLKMTSGDRIDHLGSAGHRRCGSDTRP